MRPKRLQREHESWKRGQNAVYVGGGSEWENPHRPRDRGASDDRQDAVARFRDDLLAGRLPFSEADVRRELAGKDLVCWCPVDAPCHGDVLLAVANDDSATAR